MDDPNGTVTQACLNKHPLDRAVGDDDNSPIDPNFRGRYIVDPKCKGGEVDQSKPDGAEEGQVRSANGWRPGDVLALRVIGKCRNLVCTLQALFCVCHTMLERFICHSPSSRHVGDDVGFELPAQVVFSTKIGSNRS